MNSEIKINFLIIGENSKFEPFPLKSFEGYIVAPYYYSPDTFALKALKQRTYALVIINKTENKFIDFVIKNKENFKYPILHISETHEKKFCINGLTLETLAADLDKNFITSRLKLYADLYLLKKFVSKNRINQLKYSQDKYRSLFETSIDGIVFMSLEGNIETANPAYCDMLGTSLNELRFLTYQEFTPAKWLAQDEDILINQVMKRGFSDEYKKEYIKKDGSSFPIMVRTWLVKDQDDKPLRLLKIVRDITKQSKIEAQLRQAQKMETIGTLTGGIAHDFNNILGAIIGYAQIAQFNMDNNNPAYKNIENVLIAANRAADLVKHILCISRVSEHKKKPVKILSIIEETLQLLRASLPSTIKITTEISNPDYVVVADATEIHQVIMNITTNALHAMEKKGGELNIKIDHIFFNDSFSSPSADLKTGNYVRLSVTDTGKGMDQSVLERIFDPYFTTKEKGTGTGLGLSVVHGIIQKHNGAIYASSIKNKGTTITIYLPEAGLSDKIISEQNLPLKSGNERILFIDDEKALVEIEKVMLERIGFKVVPMYNSIKALDEFKRNHSTYDLIITDMTMPSMTGLELAKKASEIKPGIPIILCTGYREVSLHQNAINAGISAILSKPVEIRTLSYTIRKVLSKINSAKGIKNEFIS